jgi:DNA-binding MarR family transcriptional regulator
LTTGYLPRNYLLWQTLLWQAFRGIDMTLKHYDVRGFESSTSLGYLLKLSHSLMHNLATAAFEGHDLSFIQWVTLMKVKEGTVMTASELCRTMCHDSGAVTRLIDQLEDRGFLNRERSKTDRRVVALKLTVTGEKKLNELVHYAVEYLNDALSDFNKSEFAQLARLLNKLVASLKSRQPQQTTDDAA